jgi:mRNA interferase RelE/StbE
MKVEYAPEAKDDLRKLDSSKRKQVLKAIEKVSANPVPFTEGGYGKPLGNKNNRNLTGLLKIKVSDVRVVYTLQKIKDIMYVIVIAARADSEVYDIADGRKLM